jgi:hypothetical protein
MKKYSRSEDYYFFWLCEKVEVVIDDPSTNFTCCPMYEKLFQKLYSTPFEWNIRNDENRAADGINLRDIFEGKTGIELNLDSPCNMLEMLIALSQRCAKDVMAQSGFENSLYFWFWQMMRNCGLSEFDDFHYQEFRVNYILDEIINRTYTNNGIGGLFPINSIDVDLRNVEIWYQLNYWLEENFDVLSEENNYIL